MELSEEEQREIADKVRSGEYFRESRQMYDTLVHDPMSERYFFVLITALAVIILLVTLFAMQSLYPLKASVPFIFSSKDTVEEVPRIHTLLAYEGEAPSEALLRFFIDDYVTFREEYDINTFDRDMASVKSQTSDEAFLDYEMGVDKRNPESPLVLYERHSRRSITIDSYRHLKGEDESEVEFTATVEDPAGTKKTRMIANISFRYSGIELDEKGRVKPVSFVVTKYRVRPL